MQPPVQCVEINMDATCDIDGRLTGLGYVTRDDEGQFIRARRLQTWYQQRIVEALSLIEALSWMKKMEIECVFETDAKILVDAIYTTKDN